MRQRFIQSFSTSGTEQTAIDEGLVGKPYVCYIQDGRYIDWNTKGIDYTGMPLTVEVLETGVLNINRREGKYSINGGEWKSVTTDAERSISVNAGDKVRFVINTAGKAGSTFSGNTIAFNVFGNIMSIAYGENFADKTILDRSTLRQTFLNCTGLESAENLVLPATSFTASFNDANDYSEMFRGCTSLVKGPAILPATTLKGNCYNSMFRDCTSLVKAPVLPATILSGSCYQNMFFGCSSLVTAPELPATVLANSCYANMFSNCSSLVDAPQLPATTLTETCYFNMFFNCTSLEEAPVLPATVMERQSYRGMFNGCTSLVVPPELPATTLALGCYMSMFNGCTSLATAPTLPARFIPGQLSEGAYQTLFTNCQNINRVVCLAETFDEYATYLWLQGVSSTGTFVKHPNATWPSDTSGIPTGWTVIDADI